MLWRLRQIERELRCEMDPAPSGAPEGQYLLLFIDGQLANCSFHRTAQSLFDRACDVQRALESIGWEAYVPGLPEGALSERLV